MHSYIITHVCRELHSKLIIKSQSYQKVKGTDFIVAWGICGMQKRMCNYYIARTVAVVSQVNNAIKEVIE